MNKRKGLMIIAASLLLIGAVSVKPAMAYFTDTHQASGAVLGKYEITPHEEVQGLTKVISVENTGDYPVYARVQLFAGSTVDLIFEADKSSGWTKGLDGFYYYNNKLDAGQTSTQLYVQVDPNGQEAESFNVVVVEEAAMIDAAGNPQWDEGGEH